MSANAAMPQPAGTETGRYKMARPLTRFEHVVHVVAGVGFLVQAITGFGSLLRFGANRGWPLLVHMMGAGVFTLGVMATALLWAHRCRFGADTPAGRARYTTGQKLMFWVYTTLGLAVMLPMLTAMLPVFGYTAQDTLVDIHQTAALLFAGAMAVHTAVSLAARRARRSAS
jgi:cytochrome b subunit of formate dehydrogenase